MSPIVPPKRVLVRKSDGWQDLAMQGPPGPMAVLSEPRARATGIGQSIGTGLWYTLTFNAEEFDNDNIFDLAQPQRLTCRTPGVYLISGHATVDQTTGGYRRHARVSHFNAAGTFLRDICGFGFGGYTSVNVVGEDDPIVAVSGFYPLNAGEYITFGVFHDMGANRIYTPHQFSMVRVSPLVTEVPGVGVGAQVPRARVYRNTDMSAAANVYTAIPYSTERFDTDNMWEAAAPTRLTAKTAGLYAFGANAIWEDISGPQGSYRGMSFRVNGTTHVGTDWRGISGPVGTCRQQVSGQWYLNVNDYLEAVVIHDRSYSGTYYASALRSVAGESLEFWAARIGS